MTCESCGADDQGVMAVHRKYVTGGSWDTERSERVLTEIEQWCFPCRTQYPHEPA